MTPYNRKSVRLTRNAAVKIEFGTEACKGQPFEINYLEHVQVVVSVSYPKRGDLQVAVRSAAGNEEKN